MQTSLDPKDWKEDTAQEMERWRVGQATPAEEKRRLFPVSCRLLVPSPSYGLKEGSTFRFARTRMIPASYPIEVLHWHQNGQRSHYVFSPREAEIISPFEDA